MSDDIRPIGGPGPVEPARERRAGDRRQTQRRGTRDLVPVAPAPTEDETFHPEPPPARAAVRPSTEPGAAAFLAQQIGQKGQKRGLRGGPPVLDAARSAYLGTEFSGPADRRPQPGTDTETEV